MLMEYLVVLYLVILISAYLLNKSKKAITAE